MCLVQGFAFLFSLAALWNLITGDFVNAAWGFGIAVFLMWVGKLLGREEKQAEEFENWLVQNKSALFDGQFLEYHGQNIGLQTSLTRFFIVFSFLVFSTKEKTRYLVRGTTKTRLAGLFCSVLTLLFGWWALPEGPLSTLWALSKNARGGEICEVAALLNQLVKVQSKEQNQSQNQ